MILLCKNLALFKPKLCDSYSTNQIARFGKEQGGKFSIRMMPLTKGSVNTYPDMFENASFLSVLG